MLGKITIQENHWVEADPILRPFLEADDERVSAQQLEHLVYRIAQPIIQSFIKSKFSAQADWNLIRQEFDDLQNSAIVHLLTELHEIKANPDRAIRDFKSYVATLTASACADYWRKRRPQRMRLQNQIRYILQNQAGLALWPIGQTLVSGFDEWRKNSRPVLSPAEFHQLQITEPEKNWAEIENADLVSMNLMKLLTVVFRQIGKPIEFSRLVNLIMRLRQIKDEIVEKKTAYEPKVEPEPVFKEDLAARIENSLYLQKLWDEINKLPLAHRSALLLNLRDGSNHGGVVTLSKLGIADLGQIAKALDISAQELAQLWNELPLDDNQIAAHLAVERQQVINLRRSARRMLSRQMNK